MCITLFCPKLGAEEEFVLVEDVLKYLRIRGATTNKIPLWKLQIVWSK